MDCDEDINFSKLHRELNIAMKEDEKYQRENAAKFRAVEQRVGSYEEFRDIVLASNIKPLERKDILGAASGSQRSWNGASSSCILSTSSKPSVGADSKNENRSESSNPRTISEFNRCWNKFRSEEEKYKFLLKLGGSSLKQLFKADVGSAPLGSIVNTLAGSLVPDEACLVTEILEALADCNRLDIALIFLGKQERKNLKNLFDTISKLERTERINLLRKAFKS